MSEAGRGRLLVTAAAVCWSTGGLIARLVGTDPWTTVFWRGIFCALFLLGVIALREGRRTADVFRAMGGTGLAIAVCFGALFGWISIGFWTALLGFALLVFRRDRFAITRTEELE